MSDAEAQKLAATLETAYQACEYEKPLESGDWRWQDLAPGRGDDSIMTLAKRFRFKAPDTFEHTVFLSHRGAGKTTELNRIQGMLRDRYYRVYFAANIELDPNHLESEDLLLAIAQGIEEDFRSAGMPLPREVLSKIEDWFAEVIKTTTWGKTFNTELAAGVSVKAEIPFFARLFGSLKALVKAESEHRTEVRSVLRKYPGTLLDVVNQLLGAAHDRLKDSNRELLIVIDNLDRYDPRVIDELLIKGAAMIRGLRANLILTPPIALLYRPISEALGNHFKCNVMNTVQLRRATQPYDAFDGPGRDLLLEALGRRMNLDALVPDVQCRNRLVSASGGAIRELLKLTQESILQARGRTLDKAAVEAAVARFRRDFRDQINANGWAKTLARIARDKQPSEEPACMDVLYHRLALKYDGQGWYDVHPLVTELEEFKAAQMDLPAP